MSPSLSVSAPETVVCCPIAASAVLRAEADTIAQWRRQAVVVGGNSFPASLLKHTDDQTVIALRAVLAAVEQYGWQQRSFTEWGVIAAPNFFGRVSIAQAIHRIRNEGAWGVSPHLIPQQSLHAISGTISQALKIHGPNFGVSCAPNATPDALLIAAAMMADGLLPGLWVVLTGYEAEWIPCAEGRAVPAPACLAIALALTPSASGDTGLHLSIGQARHESELSQAHLPLLELGSLAESLVDPHSTSSPGLTRKWRLSESHWIELEAEERP